MTVHGLTAAASTPRITDIFVRRPVIAAVLSLALVLIGIRTALELPVLQYPRIESSSLVITTPYIGADAATVQGFVTEPIERAAASIPGIDYVDSNTTAGMSTVTVWLKLGVPSTGALAELTTRLSQIRFELPAGAEDPAVRVRRADRPQAGWYLDVPLTEGMDRALVTDYLIRRVNPQIAAIPGVQEVTLEGGREPAMRVWLDPERMAAYNVSTQDIERALGRNNVIGTVGSSENADRRVNLLVDSTLHDAREFARIVIRRTDSGLIRIGDVATVELDAVEPNGTARISQEPAVFIAVWPLPGANEIDIADEMYGLLDRINETLPDGVHISIGYDVTKYMRAALKEIFTTLGETVLLVGLVVIAFMGSLRTALVPLITIPISLLGAVAAMSLMGFSLNLLTVLAIVLSVGLVVDDAIVVVENVARYMREGMRPIPAALASSRQLFAPIIAMTLTLSAVYAPIGFLSGLTGVLFKEFAFTLAVAVLISGMLALTLSPIMSARVAARETRFSQWVNRGFARLQALYLRLLDTLLRNNGKILFIAAFVSLLAVPFFLLSPSELAPREDQSEIRVAITSPPEASLDYTERYMYDVVAAMESLPGATFMWQVLFGSAAFGGMQFEPYDQRELSVHAMAPMAFGRLSAIHGVTARPLLPSALPTAGRFDVELVVMSPEPAAAMLPHALALMGEVMKSGTFMFTDTDLRIDLPQARFELDRERIADLGMDLAEVSRQLAVFLSGNFVNRFDLDGKAYRVIPMVKDADRLNPAQLMQLQLRTPSGELVPLAALATLKNEVGPRVLGKFQQNNAFRIFGGVPPGVTKEQALSALETAARRVLPPGYAIDYAGESRQLRQEGNTLMGVLGLSLAFVFFALAVQFNSFRDPLVVLLGSAPLAISGALLFTYIGWTTVNIYSQVGFITLVGLIAKNAILIVEFARQLQERGLGKLAAIREAASTRLRPVLMTTGATVMGHFPLVLVTGPGAEARNSIGIILVAGMLIGTLFTLFFLPSVYMALASRHRHREDGTDAPESVADGPQAMA
ncbi:MAG: efflux RND transporter permease subunit [Pseudomonadales bacterium]|nr:efflux RND transporter permease subunit [Pseudomonadales bacterium]MCP5185843.1 efflux RND transporter permease subunit [Pseudomonadales bacterium]